MCKFIFDYTTLVNTTLVYECIIKFSVCPSKWGFVNQICVASIFNFYFLSLNKNLALQYRIDNTVGRKYNDYCKGFLIVYINRPSFTLNKIKFDFIHTIAIII